MCSCSLLKQEWRQFFGSSCQVSLLLTVILVVMFFLATWQSVYSYSSLHKLGSSIGLKGLAGRIALQQVASFRTQKKRPSHPSAGTKFARQLAMFLGWWRWQHGLMPVIQGAHHHVSRGGRAWSFYTTLQPGGVFHLLRPLSGRLENGRPCYVSGIFWHPIIYITSHRPWSYAWYWYSLGTPGWSKYPVLAAHLSASAFQAQLKPEKITRD